jgi:hypothetical protein
LPTIASPPSLGGAQFRFPATFGSSSSSLSIRCQHTHTHNTRRALSKDPAHPETRHTLAVLPAPYRAARHALDALDAFAFTIQPRGSFGPADSSNRPPVAPLTRSHIIFTLCLLLFFLLSRPPAVRPTIRPSSIDTSWITLLILRAVALQATAVLRLHSSLGEIASHLNHRPRQRASTLKLEPGELRFTCFIFFFRACARGANFQRCLPLVVRDHRRPLRIEHICNLQTTSCSKQKKKKSKANRFR